MDRSRLRKSTHRRRSVRVGVRGYENMIGSDFEGVGLKPGLTFFHVKRGKKVKLDKLEKESGDNVFKGHFFRQDCYLFLHTTVKDISEIEIGKAGGEFKWKIYVWKGSDAGLIYFGLAGTKATNLQNNLVANGSYYDCEVINEKDGEESEEFKALFEGTITSFPGTRLMESASQAKGDAVVDKTPRLYEVFNDRLYRIPIRAEYIQDSRNYILDIGSHVYSYSSPMCRRIEKAYAEEMARRRCKADYKKVISATHVESEDEKGSDEFFEALRNYEQEPWSSWSDHVEPLLLEFDGESSFQRVADSVDGQLFDSDMLQHSGIFALDCMSEFYIWFGRGSDVKDQKLALELAEFLLNLPGRPSQVMIETVRDRMEPVYFKERFFGFDTTDLLEIGGRLDVEESNREEIKERRVSEEVRRVVQFLEETDERIEMHENLHLINDDSGTMTAFAINQAGEYTSIDSNKLGLFDSGLMYVYIYSCKNNSLHKVLTWEGNQVSIKARTIAGISTAGTIIPGITDRFTGTKTFTYMQQGKESRLLKQALAKFGRPFIIHKGRSGGGYRRKKSNGPLGFTDSLGRTMYVFQINSVDNTPPQATEIEYETLRENGLYNGNSYIFLRGKHDDKNQQETNEQQLVHQKAQILEQDQEEDPEQEQEPKHQEKMSLVDEVHQQQQSRLIRTHRLVDLRTMAHEAQESADQESQTSYEATEEQEEQETYPEQRAEEYQQDDEQHSDHEGTQKENKNEEQDIQEKPNSSSEMWFYNGPNSSADNRNFVARLIELPDLFLLTGLDLPTRPVVNLEADESFGLEALGLRKDDTSVLGAPTRPTRLFKISHGVKKAGGLFIADVGEGIFCQSDLKRNEVYLLDTGSTIVYLWFGDQVSKPQLHLGVETAARYTFRGINELYKDSESIPDVSLEMVDYGRENSTFRAYFYGWNNIHVSSKEKAPALRPFLKKAIETAKMDDNDRRAMESTNKKKMIFVRQEKERKSRAIRKSKMKTLKKGKLLKFKKQSIRIGILEKLGDRIEIDEVTNALRIKNIGKPLTILQDKFTLDEVNAEVRNGEFDWALYAYSGPKELKYQAHGTQGVNEMLENLVADNIVHYAVIRIKAEDIKTDQSRTDRMLFLIYLPEGVKPSMKAAVNVHRTIVSELLGPFFTEIVIREKSEISPETVAKIASKGQT